MDPNCLHCRIGALLKAYLEEKREAGSDDDRRVDNVLQDLTLVITDVLQQVPDMELRFHLSVMVVKEIMVEVRKDIAAKTEELSALLRADGVLH